MCHRKRKNMVPDSSGFLSANFKKRGWISSFFYSPLFMFNGAILLPSIPWGLFHKSMRRVSIQRKPKFIVGDQCKSVANSPILFFSLLSHFQLQRTILIHFIRNQLFYGVIYYYRELFRGSFLCICWEELYLLVLLSLPLKPEQGIFQINLYLHLWLYLCCVFYC